MNQFPFRAFACAGACRISGRGQPWANSCSGGDKDRRFRRRLFLVHPARIRQGPGRYQNRGGLLRRNRAKPHLQARRHRKKQIIVNQSKSPTTQRKFLTRQLLDIYWRQIDPTQADGQFTDIGPSYRAAIFYGNAEEKKIAEASKTKLASSGKFKKPIVTEILPSMKFWPAEDYHQKYYRQNPEHFEAFEEGSGRVSFKNKAWGRER